MNVWVVTWELADVMVFVVGDYAIDDWSLGGLETCIGVRSISNPDLNVAFDCGVARKCLLKCEHLFITHGHPDHCAALTNAVAKRGVASKSEPMLMSFLPGVYWELFLHHKAFLCCFFFRLPIFLLEPVHNICTLSYFLLKDWLPSFPFGKLYAFMWRTLRL